MMLAFHVEEMKMDNGISCVAVSRANSGLKSIDIETHPYPLFPTDLQPQLMSLLAVTNGTSSVVENIFENRLQHAVELNKIGADISINGRCATICGVSSLNNGVVNSTDLRAGIALVIIACAKKTSITIKNAQYIDRGYQSVMQNLRRFGCDFTVSYL